MKMFILALLLLSSTHAIAQEAFVSVCNRHPKVREALQTNLGTKCDRVTKEQLVGVLRLELRDGNPSELRTSDFFGLTNLQLLSIVGDPNHKQKLDYRLLSNFPKLTQFVVANVDLSDAPRNFIASLKNLTFAGLINCNLTEFPVLSPARMSFDFSQNRIKELPKKLPVAPSGNAEVDFLFWNLEDNQISDISSNILELTKVANLALAGNPIKPLSCANQNAFINGLKGKMLSIDVKSINMNASCDLSGFEDLSQLELSHGRLEDISEELVFRIQNGFINLVFSNFIVDNRLSRFVGRGKSIFLKNTSLANLDFSDPVWPNKLIHLGIEDDSSTSIPNVFKGTQAIRSMSVVMPNLHYFDESLLSNLPNLREISFAQTPLSATPITRFNGLVVRGLPTNFGVTETGGTSEEWAP